MEKKRILFVSQEITPFLPKSEISNYARRSPQVVQENGKEIRVFMPRFGCVNERRHQLHEVIRLSGMNLIIDDQDHPLIIKVASIPTARIQVYFIDNDEFFKRKSTVADEKGEHFVDNDERSMFFCRGVLETVKKLGWKPDVIHCHGWMTSLMPLYVKDIYGNDPHFADVKVVTSIYNERFNKNWDTRWEEKIKFEGFSEEIINDIKPGDYDSLMKASVKWSDGVVISTEDPSEAINKAISDSNVEVVAYDEEEKQIKSLSEFYDKLIESEVLID
ncbi:MAG: glycogen/starch synthase [Crocinitomicaceae bacterium]